MKLKYLKTFESYKISIVNENNDETKLVDPKMSINGGTLTIDDGENKSTLKMTASNKSESTGSKDGKLVVKSGSNMDADEDSRIFECDSWRAKYSDVKKIYREIGWDIQVQDEKGNPLQDGNKSEVLLYICVPKNYNGEIKGRSVAMGHGQAGGARRIAGNGETTWGFYNAKDLVSTDSVPAYKRVVISKQSDEEKDLISNGLSISDGFELNKSDLTDDAKAKLDEFKVLKGKVKGLTILTGATKDYEEGDGSKPSGNKIGDKEATKYEWDQYLVKNRFNAVKTYLKDLGFKVKADSAFKFEDNKPTKIYGLVNSDDLKAKENRLISVKAVTK